MLTSVIASSLEAIPIFVKKIFPLFKLNLDLSPTEKPLSPQFFNLSEEGITPRFKIRLRGYNNKKLDNLEIKTTNNYHREKITIKNFVYDNYELHQSLKKFGIKQTVQKKIRVKYLRSYYKLENVGRITLDRNIEFLSPDESFYNSKKIKQNILEVKVQRENIDKNIIEKIINLKETRFSKYCIGINCLRETN